MPASLKITITGLEEASARLTAAGRKLSEEVAPVVEEAAMKVVQDHLDANYVGQPNKLGGTPTGYWTNVRNSATAGREGKGVTVDLTGAGLLMKYMGGVIRPTGRVSSVTGKPIKFLSIPTAPESHGKIPAMFGKQLYTRGFAGGTGQSEGDSSAGMGLFLRTGSRSSDSDPLLFWLAKQATIKADKKILPPAADIQKACGDAITTLLESDP
jgi:hypothetical protein